MCSRPISRRQTIVSTKVISISGYNILIGKIYKIVEDLNSKFYHVLIIFQFNKTLVVFEYTYNRNSVSKSSIYKIIGVFL